MSGNGNRIGGEEGVPERVARMLAGDLDALRATTSGDLPPLASVLTSPSGARGRAPSAHPGGTLMNAWRNSKNRPWLVTALGTAAVALVLLFIPVSYDRLIGSELTLHISDAGLAPSAIRDIASDLRAKLGAERIRVETDAASGLTLIADIPDASWRRVGKLAIEYAQGLLGRGIQAAPRVRPRFEKAQGNVYAAIGNLVEIRIQTEGKSDQDIAAEIKNQLLAAGLTDATVEVSRQDGRTQIRVEAKKTATGEAGTSDAPCPDFSITLDGKAPGDSGTETQKCVVKVKRTEGMTDQQVIDEVKRQLQEQGVNDAEVYYENGEIQIKRPGK